MDNTEDSRSKDGHGENEVGNAEQAEDRVASIVEKEKLNDDCSKISRIENYIKKYFSWVLVIIIILQYVAFIYFEQFSFLKIGIVENPIQHPLNWITLLSFITLLLIFIISMRIQWLEGFKGVLGYSFSLVAMIGLLFNQLIEIQSSFFESNTSTYIFDEIKSIYLVLTMIAVIFASYIYIYKGINKLNYSKLTTRMVLSQCFYIIHLSIIIIFIFSWAEWFMSADNLLLKYASGNKVTNFFDIFYFNTITYFTVGYGDINAVSIFSKTLVIIESFISHLNVLLLITLLILNKRDIKHVIVERKYDRYLVRFFFALQIFWFILYIAQFIPWFRNPSWSEGYSVGGISF